MPIRLELPPEDDTNQQRLNLVVDFLGVGEDLGKFGIDVRRHLVLVEES